MGCARGRRRLRSRRAHSTCVAHDPAGGGGTHGGARDPRGARARRPAHGVRVDTGTALEPSPARAVARSPARLPPCGHAPRRRRLRRQGGRRCRRIRRSLRGQRGVSAVPCASWSHAVSTSRRCRGAGSPSRLHSTRGATARSSGSRSRSSATRARIPAPDRSSRGRRSSWRAGRTGSRRWGSGRAAYVRTAPVRAPTAGRGARRRPRRSSAALDLLARELELDPAEVRRRNLLTPTELPATSASGAHYDDGDLPALLAQLLDRAEYRALAGRATHAPCRQRRPRARHRSRHGARLHRVVRRGRRPLACACSPTVVCACLAGTASAGQLHARAYAAIVAETLPVFVDEVEVVEGDTDIVEGGAGTSGSRSLQLAGGAIQRRGRRRARAGPAHRAADLLEAAVDDVVVDGRAFVVRGVPARGITLAELAARDPRPALDASLRVRPGGRHLHASLPTSRSWRSTWKPVRSPSLRHFAVTDCGRVVDPPSATGQVVGASAQGIAQAVFEELQYDDRGNPLGTSLADYLVPAAPDLPPVETWFQRDRNQPQPTRRSRRRRSRHGRRAGGRPRCGAGRGRAPRCPAHRHALHTRTRLACRACRARPMTSNA